MSPFDWRDLYAPNRAVIERAGVSMPTRPSSPPPAGLLSLRTHPVGAPLRPDDRGPCPA